MLKVGNSETVVNSKSPDNKNQPFLIKNVYSEFNVGAFIVNLGYYHGIGPCGPNTKRDDFYGYGMPALQV